MTTGTMATDTTTGSTSTSAMPGGTMTDTSGTAIDLDDGYVDDRHDRHDDLGHHRHDQRLVHQEALITDSQFETPRRSPAGRFFCRALRGTPLAVFLWPRKRSVCEAHCLAAFLKSGRCEGGEAGTPRNPTSHFMSQQPIHKQPSERKNK